MSMTVFSNQRLKPLLSPLGPGCPLVELQVTGVQADVTSSPLSTHLALTVHSLLLVDALQTYGQDFELLVASHKHVM